jgi:hypothetical protein
MVIAKQGQEGKEIQFEKKVGNDLLWIDQVMKMILTWPWPYQIALYSPRD